MSATTEKAILAGGCFWGMQDLIRKRPGVLSTRVGYTGGEVANATYRNHGNHAEAIEITFDPSVTSYRELLEFFFQIHDPTTRNRQGNDIGASYRSAIFYVDDEQRRVAEDTIADVEASGLWPGKVVTEVEPAGPFWEAEPEHQDYLEHYPNGYTCHFPRPGWVLPRQRRRRRIGAWRKRSTRDASGDGCAGMRRVQRVVAPPAPLRRCCGHIGCCDSSPSQHASAHARQSGHGIVRSSEPGEDWFWDYQNQQYYDGPELAPPEHHPLSQPTPGPAGRVPCRTGSGTSTDDPAGRAPQRRPTEPPSAPSRIACRQVSRHARQGRRPTSMGGSRARCHRRRSQQTGVHSGVRPCAERRGP